MEENLAIFQYPFLNLQTSMFRQKENVFASHLHAQIPSFPSSSYVSHKGKLLPGMKLQDFKQLPAAGVQIGHVSANKRRQLFFLKKLFQNSFESHCALHII
jgi:hypothetical protein